MKKQQLEEFNLRLAAVENEITTLQNQITNLSQPTCTYNDLAQMKMLVSKFPLSNLKNAQYLHATQLQVANLSELNNLSMKRAYGDNRTELFSNSKLSSKIFKRR